MNDEVRFRDYDPRDRPACLALFDANCPAFFAPNERAEYGDFLDEIEGGYEVCLLDGAVVGAFGLIEGEPGEEPSLRWIMIDPTRQGQGIGSAIMRRVVSRARTDGARLVRIAASHRSAPFFEKSGAKAVRETPDGWGPGMHRIDMELAVG